MAEKTTWTWRRLDGVEPWRVEWATANAQHQAKLARRERDGYGYLWWQSMAEELNDLEGAVLRHLLGEEV
jgi:hypothetical protein